MRIYIDVSVLMLATFVTGIQRVTTEIAVRLIENRGQDVILLYYNAANNVYHRIENQFFLEYYTQHKGKKEKMITKEQVNFMNIEKNAVFFDLDAAWMCRVKRSFLLPILKKRGIKIIAHIYDIISITHPQFCLQRGVYNFMDYIGAHLQYADKIIVNAKMTEDELKKLADRLGINLPPCSIIPLGADFTKQETVSDSQVSKEISRLVKERPYILMVGTIEPRKNHRLILDAYDLKLKEMGYNIILAGYMGWNMEEFASRLKNHPDYNKRVYHLSEPDDLTIGYLYQHAKFLAFCSYTEGFGLPLIESIQQGTPVIASDIPVFREVADGYCIWFEQDNVEELCACIKKYTENDKFYQQLKWKLRSYRGQDWDYCEKKFEEIL